MKNNILRLESLARECENISRSRVDNVNKWETISNFANTILTNGGLEEDVSNLLKSFVACDNLEEKYRLGQEIAKRFSSESFKRFQIAFAMNHKWKLLVITDSDKILSPDNNAKPIEKNFKPLGVNSPNIFSSEIFPGEGHPLTNLIWFNDILISYIPISIFLCEEKSSSHVMHSDFICVAISNLNYDKYIPAIYRILSVDPYIPILSPIASCYNPNAINIPSFIYPIESPMRAVSLLETMVFHFKSVHLSEIESFPYNFAPQEFPKDKDVGQLISLLFPFKKPIEIRPAPSGFTSARNYWVEYEKNKLRFVKTDFEMGILEEFRRYKEFVEGSLENITGRVIGMPVLCNSFAAIQYSIVGVLSATVGAFSAKTIEEGLQTIEYSTAAQNALIDVVETMRKWWWEHKGDNGTIFRPFYCYGELLPPVVVGEWIDYLPGSAIVQAEELDCEIFCEKDLEKLESYADACKIIKIKNASLLGLKSANNSVEATFFSRKTGVKVKVCFNGKVLKDFNGKFRNRKFFDEFYVKTIDTPDNFWQCLLQWTSNDGDKAKEYIRKIFGGVTAMGGIPSWEVTIHGDFHLRNILFEPNSLDGESFKSVWLIDFAKTRMGCASVDLAYLEISLRIWVLSKLFANQLSQFHSTNNTCQDKDTCKSNNNEKLNKCLQDVEEILWESYEQYSQKSNEILVERCFPKCVSDIRIGCTARNILLRIRKIAACQLDISKREYACGLALLAMNTYRWIKKIDDKEERSITELCLRNCFDFHLNKLVELSTCTD